jgi:ArsR family metal-binding transcriptional regulator
MGIRQGSSLEEKQVVEVDPYCSADRDRDRVGQMVDLDLVLAVLVLALVQPDQRYSSQLPFAVAAEAYILLGE